MFVYISHLHRIRIYISYIIYNIIYRTITNANCRYNIIVWPDASTVFKIRVCLTAVKLAGFQNTIIITIQNVPFPFFSPSHVYRIRSHSLSLSPSLSLGFSFIVFDNITRAYDIILMTLLSSVSSYRSYYLLCRYIPNLTTYRENKEFINIIK